MIGETRDQAEFGDDGGFDVSAASFGAGIASSSLSDAHMPMAAKAVMASEMRRRVLAGSTVQELFQTSLKHSR